MNAAAAAPLSALELRDAVRQSRRFDSARLDRVLRTDPEREVVEVQAGTPWTSVAAHLLPDDENAARIGAGLPTVGTSIAWNAAGPDGRPAVEHVDSLTLVTPDGELRRASRAGNADLFALTIGGQGVVGALYSVTLRLASLARALTEAAPFEVRAAAQHEGPTRRLQLLLPPDAVDAYLLQAHAVCEAWRAAVVRLELRPTRPEQETYLSWARRAYVRAWRREIGAELRDSVLIQKYLFSTPARMDRVVRVAQTRPEFSETLVDYASGRLSYRAARRRLIWHFPRLLPRLALQAARASGIIRAPQHG